MTTLLGWCALVILEVTSPAYLPHLLYSLTPSSPHPYEGVRVAQDDARRFFARCPAGQRQAWLIVHVLDRPPIMLEVTAEDRRRLLAPITPSSIACWEWRPEPVPWWCRPSWTGVGPDPGDGWWPP